MARGRGLGRIRLPLRPARPHLILLVEDDDAIRTHAREC
jgi:hypothetical protein